MKYIPAEKLITIIEERKAQQDQWIERYHDIINQGISQELAEILSIITSLQQEQPEVDLEKVYDSYCKVCGHYHHTTPDFICRQACDYFKVFKALLNARKEE